MIKQIHNQLCLLAGKRAVLLEKSGSTPPPPPSLKIVSTNLTFMKVERMPTSRLTSTLGSLYKTLHINIRAIVRNKLRISSDFSSSLNILPSLIRHYRIRLFYNFLILSENNTSFPNNNSSVSRHIQSICVSTLCTFLTFSKFKLFTTPITPARFKHMFKLEHYQPLGSNPISGYNIKPCHLN